MQSEYFDDVDNMAACVVPFAVPAGILLAFWLGYHCNDRFGSLVERFRRRYRDMLSCMKCSGVLVGLGTSIWAMQQYIPFTAEFFTGTDWSLSYPRCTPLFWDVHIFLNANPGSSAIHKYAHGTSLVMLCTDIPPDAFFNYSSFEKAALTAQTSYLKTLYTCSRDENATLGSCYVSYYVGGKVKDPKAKTCAELLKTPPEFNGFLYVSEFVDYSTNGCKDFDIAFREIDHAIGPCHLQYVYPLEHHVKRMYNLDIVFMTIFLVNMFQCVVLAFTLFNPNKENCLFQCFDCCCPRFECYQYASQLPCCATFVTIKFFCDDTLGGLPQLTKQRPPFLFFILALCFSVVEAIGIPIATLNGAYCPFCSYKTEWAFLFWSAYGIFERSYEYIRGPSNRVKPAPAPAALLPPKSASAAPAQVLLSALSHRLLTHAPHR